tara:strand:+ start:174 stop:383 length:210 start_codon:yes stop_codon:yes gene_type:complete
MSKFPARYVQEKLRARRGRRCPLDDPVDLDLEYPVAGAQEPRAMGAFRYILPRPPTDKLSAELRFNLLK